jgi:hypothetical protein
MAGVDPVDNGFGRHTAELTGFENSQYVFHRNAPFRFSGCQKNVAVFKRFFDNRTFFYSAIPYLGKLLWKVANYSYYSYFNNYNFDIVSRVLFIYFLTI